MLVVQLGAHLLTWLTFSLSLSLPPAGVDFEPQSVQLTFPPTNQSILDDLYQLPIAQRLSAPLPESSPVCSRVEIIDDNILEETEEKLLRLELTLGGPHVHFESPSSVLVTILDDDGE